MEGLSETVYAGDLSRKDKGPLTIHDNKDKTYTVEYVPSAPGKQQLRILWAGKAVSGSPFPLVVRRKPDGDILVDLLLKNQNGSLHPAELTEEGTDGGETDVNVTTDRSLLWRIKVQTSELKKGKLTATVTGDAVGPAEIKASKKSRDTFEILFTPPEPDRYLIKAMLTEQPIPLTPLVANYTDQPETSSDEPVQVESLAVEETIPPLAAVLPQGDLESNVPMVEPEKERIPSVIEEDDKDEGTVIEIDKTASIAVDESELPADIQEPQPIKEITEYIGSPVTVKLKVRKRQMKEGDIETMVIGDRTGPGEMTMSRKNDLLLITFNPKQTDRYTIEIKLKGKHVPDSPFIVTYLPPPPDASKCRILGLKDLPEVLEVNNEIPLVVDATEAGNGILDVQFDQPQMDGEPPELEVTSTEDELARFHVKYLPKTPGVHNVSFKWSGETIPASPVRLAIVDLAAVVTYPYGAPVITEEELDSKLPKLKAYAVHVGNRKNLKVKITRAPNGHCKFNFSPKESGLYYIHVLSRHKEIEESPFVIRVDEPPKPEAVTIQGLGKRGYVGEMTTFTINGSNAGSGEASVKPITPSRRDKGTLTVHNNEDKHGWETWKPG